MRFFVHSDPEEQIGTAIPVLQGALDRRVPTYHPRASRVSDARYVVVELDGDLARPAPGTPGADEEVVAAVEEAVPSSIGLLIWLEVSEERTTLLFLRANADNPDATGEAYLPPYSHPLRDKRDADTVEEPDEPKGSRPVL
jgi:hypothetical protein